MIRRPTASTLAAAALALVALVASACISTQPTVVEQGATPSPETPVHPDGGTLPLPSTEVIAGLHNIPAVAERVSPSVVLVRAFVERTDADGETAEGFSSGSGVVFDSEGHVMTNNHVVEGATTVDIVFPSGQEVDVEVVGADPSTDIAVLEFDPRVVEDLAVTPLVLSTDVRIGDWVIAIGNPLGFEGTLTVGVISAKDRSLQVSPRVVLHDLLQTDAVINPGNSGGPLLNLEGEVIGINTAIIRGQLASGQEAEGIGFAVATTTAIPVAAQLIQNGRVIWPRIGVSIDDVTPVTAAEEDLSVDKGLLVRGLAPGGPAEMAGIEVGDVIIAIDGHPVEKFSDLRRLMLFHYKVGDSVLITIVRGAVTLDYGLTLDELVL